MFPTLSEAAAARGGRRRARRGARRRLACLMRVWIDLTNSPHVPDLRAADPAHAGARLGRGGHRPARSRRRSSCSSCTGSSTRWSATTAAAPGLGKARAAAGRVAAMVRFGRRGRFDAAIAHGSTDLPMACRALRVPNTTMFDYEFARLQHSLNCRLATRVLMPDAIPAGARAPSTAPARRSWSRYPGLKEEYYLADFEPDPAVPAALGLDGVADRRRPAPAGRRRALPPVREPAVRRAAGQPGRA